MSSNHNLSQALELYKLVWELYTCQEISIEEIDLQERGLGLIGPGDGILTYILEKCFGRFNAFRLHALFHDVFGRIYNKTKKGPGYMYVYDDAPAMLKRSSLCGHISGLSYCLVFGKGICEKISKRYTCK